MFIVRIILFIIQIYMVTHIKECDSYLYNCNLRTNLEGEIIENNLHLFICEHTKA